MVSLKKYARIQKNTETEMLTARIPKEVYMAFKEHCKGLGLTITDGVYYLMVEEMQRLEEEKKRAGASSHIEEIIQSNTEDIRKHTEAIQSITIDSQQLESVLQEASAALEGSKPAASKHIEVHLQPARKKNTNAGKGNGKDITKPYEIEGKVPCPICKKWASASNFARDHAKKHGTSTIDIYTGLLDEIKAMYREKLAEMQTEPQR